MHKSLQIVLDILYVAYVILLFKVITIQQLQGMSENRYLKIKMELDNFRRASRENQVIQTEQILTMVRPSLVICCCLKVLEQVWLKCLRTDEVGSNNAEQTPSSLA